MLILRQVLLREDRLHKFSARGRQLHVRVFNSGKILGFLSQLTAAKPTPYTSQTWLNYLSGFLEGKQKQIKGVGEGFGLLVRGWGSGGRGGK